MVVLLYALQHFFVHEAGRTKLPAAEKVMSGADAQPLDGVSVPKRQQDLRTLPFDRLAPVCCSIDNLNVPF